MESRIFTECETAFCRIRIEEFLSSTHLPSDIFIRIGEQKMIRLAREGMAIDIGRIQNFKEKNLKYLFVRNADLHKYTGLNLKVAKAVSKKSEISDDRKFQLYKHTGEILVRQVFVSGLDEKLCGEAQEILSNAMKIVGENDDLFELLLVMQESDDRLYSHSVATAFYSCMISKKLGWNSSPNQYKLTIASLFHDVGMREVPPELHDKPRIKMSPDETRLREGHSIRGRDILIGIKGIPSDIVQIVAQHHENQLAAGYPMALPAVRIHPLAKVLHLADDFSYHLIKEECRSLCDVRNVLVELFQTSGDEYDFAAMAALFESLELSRPSAALRNSA